MIRIRRIHRTLLPIERERLTQVQDIFRDNFADTADYADKIPELLNDPIKYGYTTVLLVSETGLGRVTGFSLVMLFPNIRSALLDFLAVRRPGHGSGTGGMLYEASREYLMQSGCLALFMEVLPDDPRLVEDPAELKENQRRLRFYEQFGVRPIVGTEYETPIGSSSPPYLLFDGLGRSRTLRRSQCRAVMRTILTKKYSDLVTPDYIERVIESVIEEPVHIREPRYLKNKDAKAPLKYGGRLEKAFVMVSGNAHEVHHVHERGYVERPARVRAIRESLEKTGLFQSMMSRSFKQEHILEVHDAAFCKYLKAVCRKLGSRRPIYPYVFPIRHPERRPKDLAVRAGYYCIDTFTPLDRNAFTAAESAVDVALTAADQVLRGRSLAYALCRPPGHHAEREVFGGFCYFNNAAIAAQFLSRYGKVAILDVDYHHGNGAQSIFARRSDVLTVSIHGHPNIAYPYFSGFPDETGEEEGEGFNINFALSGKAGEEEFMAALNKSISRIRQFSPVFLVVCLGFDVMKGDPTGSFDLRPGGMKRAGRMIGSLNLPILVIQEGGYSLVNLKSGAAAFFGGIADTLKNMDKSSWNKKNTQR